MREAYLAEDSGKLSFIRISWRPYDLLEGDRHMLNDNVQVVVSRESFEGGHNILVLKLSIHVQCLCSRLGFEGSHMDELYRIGLSNSYCHEAAEFNIVDLLVRLPWGFPRHPQLEGATRWRSDSPR